MKSKNYIILFVVFLVVGVSVFALFVSLKKKPFYSKKDLRASLSERVVCLAVYFPNPNGPNLVLTLDPLESKKAYLLLLNSEKSKHGFVGVYRGLFVFYDGYRKDSFKAYQFWFNIHGGVFFSDFGYSKELGEIFEPILPKVVDPRPI